ncbi:hypothetical protein F0562_034324 [Nyssa sinensis]|uniref:Uncharacterized protein n=1 Tax=Nyssa sinensis TaxID=561372 RepID=A0A5J5AIM7_9ASTE|nr:hypothetical protein F0562_034324 [Nyssa sinensis]
MNIVTGSPLYKHSLSGKIVQKKGGTICGHKIEGSCAGLVAAVPTKQDNRGLPRIGTWVEMKLKLDEKFLPLITLSLYDQLVARYMAGLKFNLQSELMLHSIHSLEEAYQMALKAEEKAKWTPFRKSNNCKASNEKMVTKSKKNSAPNSQHPNPHAGKEKRKVERLDLLQVLSVSGVVKLVIAHTNVPPRKLR